MSLPINRFYYLSWLAAISLLGLLVACSSSADGEWVGDYVTTNDFESVRGWGGDASAITRDHTYSGQYAIFVSPEREYSFTYDLPLHEASLHPLKGIVVEGWVYLSTKQSSASLDVQVRLPGPNGQLGFTDRLMLPEQVKEGAKWTHVRKEFIFPAGLPGDAHLLIFLWRNSSHEPVYLDDLRVKALE
jgi:hypothetical protein